VEIVTVPSRKVLEEKAARTPEFMRPDKMPYAAVLEGFIPASDCDDIIAALEKEPIYNFPTCGAATREVESHPTLNPIEGVARAVNWLYWNYDLDDGQYSWMQTYSRDGCYKRHMDGSPGQTRKLTAVVMLSDPDDYKGGHLELYPPTGTYEVPRTRGTVVVFLPWIEHEVTMVFHGTRQTINMGFWGPPFR
jgi:hypothetical protein